jgi:hypothetical protein
VTPFGRKGETIGALSRRIEVFAARNIGSLDPKFGSFCPNPGTISESGRLVRGTDGGTIAMRIEYLAAIAIAAFAAGSGLAVYSVGSLPSEKQSTPAATQLATLLAESVDPFLHGSGG